MEDNNILELIKNQDSKAALNEMENKFTQILLNKLKKSNVEVNNNNSFMHVVDDCIKAFPEDYDILTYLKNTLFFSEKTDSEKLYELAYIYENLNEQ